MTPQERINRGEAAKRLMEDETLAAAFENLERRYTENWANSLPHDESTRELSYRKLRVLGDLQSELKSQITDGDMARSRSKS